MKRRDLLKTVGALGVASLVSDHSASAAEKLWKTAVGLNGFVSGESRYKRKYPIWEILHFASEAGFDGVELVEQWHWSGYPTVAETERIDALRRMYDAYGLQIFSIQLSVGQAFAPEAELRGEWLETFTEQVKFAAAVGCVHVGMWPGGGLRGQTMEQAITNLGHSFHAAADIAGEHGIIPCFEIEPPFVFNTEEHMQRILAAADHPNLKVIYDPSHFDLMNGSTGKPHEMLQRIGLDRLGYLHFIDTDGTLRDGGTSKHLPCGEGHADLEQSLLVLKEGGFQGWIMIDEWEVPDPYHACISPKKLIERVQG